MVFPLSRSSAFRKIVWTAESIVNDLANTLAAMNEESGGKRSEIHKLIIRSSDPEVIMKHLSRETFSHEEAVRCRASQCEKKDMTRQQCKKCPWKVGVDPRTIPNGYDEKKHAALESTIAKDESVTSGFTMMACHESKLGKELPCVGWLHNQLGTGNNLGLRFAVIQGRVDADFEITGPQHARFEDTLPTRKESMR